MVKKSVRFRRHGGAGTPLCGHCVASCRLAVESKSPCAVLTHRVCPVLLDFVT